MTPFDQQFDDEFHAPIYSTFKDEYGSCYLGNVNKSLHIKSFFRTYTHAAIDEEIGELEKEKKMEEEKANIERASYWDFYSEGKVTALSLAIDRLNELKKKL